MIGHLSCWITRDVGQWADIGRDESPPRRGLVRPMCTLFRSLAERRAGENQMPRAGWLRRGDLTREQLGHGTMTRHGKDLGALGLGGLLGVRDGSQPCRGKGPRRRSPRREGLRVPGRGRGLVAPDRSRCAGHRGPERAQWCQGARGRARGGLPGLERRQQLSSGNSRAGRSLPLRPLSPSEQGLTNQARLTNGPIADKFLTRAPTHEEPICAARS